MPSPADIMRLNSGAGAPGVQAPGTQPPPGFGTNDDDDDKPLTLEQQRNAEFGGTNPLGWAAWIDNTVGNAVGDAWKEATGLPASAGLDAYSRISGELFGQIETLFLKKADDRLRNLHSVVRLEYEQGNLTEQDLGPMSRKYYTDTPEGQQELLDFAFGFVGKKLGLDASDYAPSGGGGGGSRGHTAQEIRNQFDLDHLESLAQEQHRAVNLSEWKDARKVAREYVDAVVKTKAEVEMDFDTFVRKRIEATPRFKAIYANKPESVTAEQYISPYITMAHQYLRPGDAADSAVQAAQFGASGASFQANLQKEDAVTGEAPFIQSLEGRLQSLNSVLKG